MTKNQDIYISPIMEQLSKNMNYPERAYFFDTTLRDGEQTSGISFNLDGKIAIGNALNELGIDVIEAGFPVVSKEDFECCKQLAKLGLDSEIMGLARMNIKDIDRCIEADLDGIHVFISTSDLHIKEKLKSTREEVLEKIVDKVTYAKKHFTNILFSAEDATRTDLDYLIKANQTAVENGANRVNVPDTVGTISPNAFGYIIKKNYEALPKNIRIAAHCHNDFGLAVANTIAAFENGASEAQTTILGIGERAGNASFEETAMSLYALCGIPLNINLKKIYPTAKLVERLCDGGYRISELSPLIGKNAFVHEAGIHAHGMLQNARVYEPISPALLGIPRSDDISEIIAQSIKFGKHSGGHAIKAKLDELKIDATKEQQHLIQEHIKRIGERQHKITDDDFDAIVRDVMGQIPESEKFVILEELTVVAGSLTPTATVRLKIKTNGDYVEKVHSSIGCGPIDAALKAIMKCYSLMNEIKLIDFNIKAVTGGTDALGHVTVEVLDIETKNSIRTDATHEDIVMSSVLAMVRALNKLTILHDKNN